MSRKRSPTPIVAPEDSETNSQRGSELKEKILRGLSGAVVAGALVCYAQLGGRAPVDLQALGKVALYAVAFLLLQSVFQAVMAPVGQSLITRKSAWSREVWRAKVDRFAAAVYKLLINGSGLAMAWYLVKDQDWIPSYLGGSGETRNLWSQRQSAGAGGVPDQRQLVEFYLTCMGFLVSDLVTHLVWERKRPDFSELMLHMLVSFAFLSVAFISNFLRLGVLVILIHLGCDVFVYAAKAFVDTKLSGGVMAFFPLLFVHGYFRLYVFSKILRSVVVEAAQVVPKTWAPWGFLSVALGLSLLMQAFWGFVIVKIGLLLLTTGQSRDLQANLSAMDLHLGRKSKSGRKQQ